MRYINDKCPSEHDPTVEDSYKVNIQTKSGEKEISILDTAGEEDYQNMLDKWLSVASGFILVFAINDLETFTALKTIIARIKKRDVGDLPFILVGNKIDLIHKREVTAQQAQELAKALKAKYFETSALNDENGKVKEVFQECGNMIFNLQDKNDDNGKTCYCNIY